jgi:dihydrofolate synthase/folylpolyglutamate synthase
MADRASLDYLYSLQTFGIKLGLDNIRTLLERLGHPEQDYPCVLVAGTNGKGSTSATLATITTVSGLRTGLYTSPHLHCFSERVQIDGVAITLDAVDQLVDELRIVGQGLPLTFFEFTTALALEHFRRQQVALAVLEVGMGGRLDATNAVFPCLSVITPIARDHEAWLGETLTAIAGEKAGILRPGVPAVISRQEPEAETALLAAASSIAAPRYQGGVDFSLKAGVAGTCAYRGLDTTLDNLHPALSGRHQLVNMETALAAAELLRRQGLPLPDSALSRGVATVHWPGRLEWRTHCLLLDGAHNGAGASTLADYLADAGIKRVHWVVGVKQGKDLTAILAPVLPFTVAAYCVAPPIEAAVPPEEIAAAVLESGVPARVWPTPLAALAAARSACGEGEIVLVAGSLFLVAAIPALAGLEESAVVS